MLGFELIQGPRLIPHRFVAAFKMLEHGCFRIDNGDGSFGTGFAFAPGLAFTADHNPRCAGGRTTFDGIFFADRRQTTFKLDWLQDWSSEAVDIGVLRYDPATAPGLVPVRVGYFRTSRTELLSVLSGQRVLLYGFPYVRDAYGTGGQQPVQKHGVISPDQVEMLVPEKDSENEPIYRDRLAVLANAFGYLGGLSGAPIYWPERDCVVAVEGSRHEDAPVIHGTLIHRLLEDLEQHGIANDELRQHLLALDDAPVERPRRRSSKAELARFLSSLLVAAGQFGIWYWRRLAASAAALGILAVGAVNASLLLYRPRAPKIDFRGSGILRPKDGRSDELKIAFSDVADRRFCLWFTSGFWVNRSVEIPVDSLGRGEVSLPLEPHPRPTTTDPYRAEIEIVYRRSFLLHPLAPVVVKRFSLRSLVAGTAVISPPERSRNR